ncbi:molybdopterin-containing oxidoreductase family protein [Sandaracinobacteroides saxicola]|uniref:Molybdopterin-dependent oxidoreductase n=1 Tax=Sandaracinobacteroides saxicola TaxID=2759707 RepID=A0A7G5IGB5_9SPHN|nr:molybdopterin-dependent oxidoreductase [Sandaracinobacteroides saxicola]QMW22407.1 molybdopterin-dependent oxidoreductase [Sandaracinobacteroides saxicola]
MTEHRTFCRFCHANCAMIATVEEGRVTAVRGDPDDAMYGGYTCIKGRQLADAHNHPTRLTMHQQRQADGSFVGVDSETALSDIAARLRAIVDAHGPHSVAFYCGTYAFQNSAGVGAAHALATGIGTRNFYTSVTLDQPAKVYTVGRLGTWGGGVHSFSDADACIFVGNNPLVSHYAPPGGVPPFSPSRRLRDRLDAGLKLVVIDPRRTEVARLAHIHLQPKPGEDAAILAAIVQVMIAERLIDEAFCQRHVGNLDALREAVAPFTPKVAAARAGVAAGDIVAAARLFGGAKRGAISTGTGPEMAGQGNLVAWLVAAINIIGGRFYREGETSAVPRVFTPGQGPRRAQVEPPVRPWGEGYPASRFRGLTQLGFEMPCNVLADEMLVPGEGQVRALINIGGNPVVAFPNPEKMVRALAGLELLVSVDIRMSQTARRSDYVLAPSMCLEREDITNLSEWWFETPYARYARALVPPPGEVLDEYEMLWELAKRMGVPMPLAGGPCPMDARPTKAEFLDLMSAGCRVAPSVVRADTADGAAITYPDQAAVVEPGADNGVRFDLVPDDLGELLAATLRAPTADYPFRMTSRRSAHVFNSSGHQYAALAKRGTANFAWMHPEDMAALGLADEAAVTIASKAGALPGLVKADADMRRGVISMSHAFGDVGRDAHVAAIGSTTGRLVDETVDYDPITGQSLQSAIPVRVVAA